MKGETEMIKVPDNWINPNADLVGIDGNAFSIIGFTQRELRRAGNSTEIIDQYQDEATSGDYDHVIQTSMLYCGMLQ